MYKTNKKPKTEIDLSEILKHLPPEEYKILKELREIKEELKNTIEKEQDGDVEKINADWKKYVGHIKPELNKLLLSSSTIDFYSITSIKTYAQNYESSYKKFKSKQK